MGRALFYHLTRSPAETLVRTLIDKAGAAGWRVELRMTAEAQADRFDLLLWQGDGFMPHGRAGGPHDARQPVLLTVSAQGAAPQPAGNGAACLVTLGGAAVAAEECAALERACIVFDGADPAAVETARAQWRALTGAGVTAEYWSEEAGRWTMKTRSGG